MKHKYYPCSICKGKNFQKIFERGIFFDKIFISICKDCGVVCQNPRMNELFFRRYYAKKDYYGRYQPPIDKVIKVNKKRGEMIYRQVRNFINKSSIILEIGAGRGDNLLVFKEKGFFNLYATETNKDSVFLLRSLNIKTFGGRLESYSKLSNKKFDLIILSHVLEHFVEPDKMLTIIRKLLNNKGHLFILVPNFLSSTNSYNQFTLPHLFYFSKNSLSNLISVNNFTYNKISLKNSQLSVLCEIIITKNHKSIINEYADTLGRIKSLKKPKLTMKERLANLLLPIISETIYKHLKELVLR